MKIKVEVSARHMHITRADLETLFGEGYELENIKDLSQPGQFASSAEVILEGPKGRLEGVRILGPCRPITQIELAKTDCIEIGVKAPLRLSGKIIGSGAVKVIGPNGEIDLSEGVIVAKRHIHANPEQARNMGLVDGKSVKVRIDGPRATVFEEVEVRVNEDYEAICHLDTDEGNASGVDFSGDGEIIS